MSIDKALSVIEMKINIKINVLKAYYTYTEY